MTKRKPKRKPKYSLAAEIDRLARKAHDAVMAEEAATLHDVAQLVEKITTFEQAIERSVTFGEVTWPDVFLSAEVHFEVEGTAATVRVDFESDGWYVEGRRYARLASAVKAFRALEMRQRTSALDPNFCGTCQRPK